MSSQSNQAIQTSPMSDCVVYTKVTEKSLERQIKKENSLFHKIMEYLFDFFYE